MIPGTLGTLFAGGGGFELGAMAAGLTPIWAIEIEAAIAAVHARNLPGGQLLVSDVCAVDYGTLPRPWWIHASTTCTTASQANTDAGETELDKALAAAVCRAITALRPVVFSLENVWFYRTFGAFKSIVATLRAQGYAVDWWHLNSADYGVPQTRKRLILVARLDGTPVRPQPTHCDLAKLAPAAGQLAMELADHPSLPAWNGWYAAVADVAHTFEPTAPAPWQEPRLPAELREMMLVDGTHRTGAPLTVCDASSPAFTVTATAMRRPGNAPMALLISDFDGSLRNGDAPARTVWAGASGGAPPRALIVKGTDAGSGGRGWRKSDEPMFTVTGGVEKGQPRAFIIGTQRAESKAGLTIRQDTEPIYTVTAAHGDHPLRAWLGYWVRVPVRFGLARFQSVPDWYWLPPSPVLACRIVGNMVPPLLAQLVVAANYRRRI